MAAADVMFNMFENKDKSFENPLKPQKKNTFEVNPLSKTLSKGNLNSLSRKSSLNSLPRKSSVRNNSSSVSTTLSGKFYYNSFEFHSFIPLLPQFI